MNYNNGNYGGMPFSYQTPYYGNMYGQSQQYNRQQPIQQQPMAQPQQTPMQFEMPIQYVGYGTLKEAEAYILNPNAKGIFIDRSNNMYYEKICNNDGLSYIKYFKEVKPNEEKQESKVKSENNVDYSMFATKKDLGSFVNIEEYNKLLNKIQSLEKQIGERQNVRTKQQS